MPHLSVMKSKKENPVKINYTVLLLFALLVTFDLSAAGGKTQKIEKVISSDWKIIDMRTDAFSPLVGENDRFQISAIGNTFSYWVTGENIEKTGIWTLTDSLLTLVYDLKDVSKTIDSVVYNVEDHNPELLFFSEGCQITGYINNELISDVVIEHYEVIVCSADSLVLHSDTKTFTCVKDIEKVALAHNGDAGFGLKSLFRGLFGLLVILGIAWVFSTNRKAISWRLVGFGLLIQITIAFLVLKVSIMQSIFEFFGKIFIKILNFSNIGGNFLFESFVTGDVEIALINFAFQILPTIIFFSALTSILFYYGIIQKVVYVMAWILKKALKISGAESLSATGNIFVGQTEAPLLIKEYLEKMNKSEIMLVMTGGMATIAGGVLAIYIGLLGGTDPVEQMLFAKHLISASVMAAPGAIVAAKMLVPQTESIESEVKITKDKIGSNILEAVANGTTQGLKLAVNVAAMLLVFIALIAMLNYILGKMGDWTTLNVFVARITNGQYEQISLQFVLGYALSPLAWAMGVCKEDMTLVAQLLGEKTILNEMIGFISLKEYISVGAFAEQKSIIMATYMLCGFANFSSIGIQLGGIGALAPSKRTMLSRLGFRALLGGTIASLLSATIVGIIIG